MSRTIGRAAAAVAIVLLSTSVGPGIAGAADRGRHAGHDHSWPHRRVPRLTAEQRQCLRTQLPARLRPARTPRARVAAVRAAFTACGITFGPGKPTTTTSTTTTTTTTTTQPPPIEPN